MPQYAIEVATGWPFALLNHLQAETNQDDLCFVLEAHGISLYDSTLRHWYYYQVTITIVEKLEYTTD